MITAAGIALLALAGSIWLCGDTTNKYIRATVVATGAAGFILLLASAIILSLRYMP